MLSCFLAILFILKCKFSRNYNLGDYIRRKYDGSTLQNYRRLESSTRKWKKAQLDYEFLLYCRMCNIVPNFIKFKLYRSSLYNSEFYRSSTESLLNLEIDFKNKVIKRLGLTVSSLTATLYDSLSFIDGHYIKSLLKRNLSDLDSCTLIISYITVCIYIYFIS